MIEAGDGIAAQYQAFRGYADLARARGDDVDRRAVRRRAPTSSSSTSTPTGESRLARGSTPAAATPTALRSPAGARRTRCSWPTTRSSTRTAARPTTSSTTCTRCTPNGRPSNIESSTYVPDVLFAYGRSEQGWAWMKDIIIARWTSRTRSSQQGTNGDYPEMPFTLVSQTVEGLAGVVPDAPSHCRLHPVAAAARTSAGWIWTTSWWASTTSACATTAAPGPP